MLHDPCSTPLIRPRERVGQDSMASAAPAGHSAPMPMPSSARNRNSNTKVGADAGEQVAHRVPQDRDHQRRLAPDAIGEPAGADGAHQPQPQGDGEDGSHFDQRHVERLRDRHHDQEEDGEVERVEGPTEPGGDPCHPLILGGLFPPRDLAGYISCHCHQALLRLCMSIFHVLDFHVSSGRLVRPEQRHREQAKPPAVISRKAMTHSLRLDGGGTPNRVKIPRRTMAASQTLQSVIRFAQYVMHLRYDKGAFH